MIGVISAHTEAPHAFTQAEVDFVVTSASLVASAIENARLYDETRARVEELEAITELAEVIAGARTLDELLPEVVARARGLLRASACHLYLLEPGSEELAARGVGPASQGGTTRTTLGLAELGPELARGGRRSRVAVPLVAGDELLGLLVAEQSTAVDIARAVASQIAVGVKKIQLIESLTEKNLIKDFFEALAAGRDGGIVEGRAMRLGCDLDRPHVVLAAEPADDALERALLGLFPGSLFDRREDSLRGLLRLPAGGSERAAIETVRRAHADCPRPLAIGLSSACAGPRELRRGLRGGTTGALRDDRAQAGGVGRRVRGARRLQVPPADRRRRWRSRCDDRGGDPDRRLRPGSGAVLLPTLEEFLKRHGSIGATADALYIHANTLRQRLRRIGDLSGIDLRRDDWLMIEIAVKLVQLRIALAAR